MALFFEGLVAIGLLLAGVGLLYGSIQLNRLSTFLQTGMLRVFVEGEFRSDCCCSYAAVTASPGGHAVYIFTEGKWVLHTDSSQANYEPVMPQIPGAYEGQVVRTVCVLQGQTS